MGNTNRSFLGIGWSFPPTFRNEFYGVDMLEKEEVVKSSIHIILATITGERVMLPTFGCNLQPFVFEVMNVPNITLIEKIVKEVLVFHEPRIIVESVSTDFNDAEGILNIRVEYTIITTNTRYNYVYPFYINEATNIEK